MMSYGFKLLGSTQSGVGSDKLEQDTGFTHVPSGYSNPRHIPGKHRPLKPIDTLKTRSLERTWGVPQLHLGKGGCCGMRKVVLLQGIRRLEVCLA